MEMLSRPQYIETLLVKEQGSVKKRRMSGLLPEILIPELLHNLLILPLEQGGLP